MGEGWAKYKKGKGKLTKEIGEMFTKIPHPRHNFSNGLPYRRQSLFELVPNRKRSQNRKWAANDPPCRPQMIPTIDRK